MDRPIDGISYREAQVILGRSKSWIGDRVRDGTLKRGPHYKRSTLSRADVERLALAQWARRRHTPGGYWATTTEVAAMLGTTSGWVRQLAAQGLLPAERVRGRWWLFRRAQIEVLVRARQEPPLVVDSPVST